MPLYWSQNPESLLREQLRCQQPGQSFALHFPFEHYYLPEKPVSELLAFIQVLEAGWQLSLTPASTELLARFKTLSDNSQTAAEFANQLGLDWFNPAEAWLLDPVQIAKPWGQEIWFTGIEARGQSGIRLAQHSVPLPWLLTLAPQLLTGQTDPRLILLKILDPLPDEVYGDLYFELHEQKQEVYVVTRIDPTAWPQGQGGIRFGFNPELRAQYADDTAFKQAYLQAVRHYEAIRRDIDARFDSQRQQQAIGLNEPVSAHQLQVWQQELPAELIEREQQARQAMDAFAALRPLSLGEVVKVPCFTPHSLQHGVQTVEFQTPVYERKILSFAQKVLTQDHWDTDSALEQIELAAPVIEALPVLAQSPGLRLERIVHFDDFEVQRLYLAAGQKFELPELPGYGLLMLIDGALDLRHSGKTPLQPGQAVLLSGLQSKRSLTATADSLLLLALPSRG